MTDIALLWLAPVLAVAAWPAAVVVVVLAALILTPRDQCTAILAGVAEVFRAARGKDSAPPAAPIPTAPASTLELNSDPVSDPHQC